VEVISLRLELRDPSGAGEARRRAVVLAERLGFDEEQRGRIAIAVTEACTNVLRHGKGGELLLAVGANDVLEMLAIDRGGGMDVDACLRDGYSSAGTRGEGLGAIRRQSDLFDAWSGPPGTVLFAQWKGPQNALPGPAGPCGNVQCGAVSVPKPGEEACGDDWAAAQSGDRRLFLVVDGLGHGPSAATAARTAVETFRANVERSPEALLEVLHEALRPTRGAAAAIAELDLARSELRYAGVGNIAASIVGPDRVSALVSMNGILGHGVHRRQQFSQPWSRDALLVMHSDGLGMGWKLGRYPGLAARHPAVIAGVLYRDFGRDRDDATVLVVAER
jgi:anti-sigma regulatory factor (Ser/Thr protein kinase)